MSRNRLLGWLLVLIGAVVGAIVCRTLISTALQVKTEKPNIAMVVGGEDSFWKIVIAGAREAAAQYGVNLDVRIPDEKAGAQMAVLTQIDPAKIDGLAISPMSPSTQTKILSRIAAQTNLVTFDNDAPQSLRHCYILSVWV